MLHNKMTKYIVFIMSVLLPATVSSAPSISAVTMGSSVIISGSDFGTKSTATPLLFDDFNHGTDGVIVRGTSASHYGSWEDEQWDADAVYSTANQRPGSNMSSKHPLRVNVDENHAPLKFKKTGGFTYVYMSFWIRWTWGNVVDVSGNYQIKWWQFGGLDVGGATSGPLLNSVMFKDADYSTHDLFSDDSASTNACDSSISPAFVDGRWVRVEFQAKLINDTTGSASSWVFMNPGTTAVDQRMNCSGVKTIADGETEVYDVLFLGEYLTNSNDPDGDHGADLYYDNVYVDDSWARVEIGDANTWAGCTTRENLIPTAWSTTSITADLNQGSFSDGDTAYLYVVDSNGDVNASGYEITIPSSATHKGITISGGVTIQ